MATFMTPGIYIAEHSALPNSVVEVPTAVPAFIGYTERADNHGTSLHLRPFRIASLAEFHQYFGGGPVAEQVRFSLVQAPSPAPATPTLGDVLNAPLAQRDSPLLRVNSKDFQLRQTHGWYLLHSAMRLFFLNGGGACVVVSVGTYQTAAGKLIDGAVLQAALKLLEKEPEPTLVVVPDAVLLPKPACDALQVQMLAHCGGVMKNRMALIDVWEGYLPRNEPPFGDLIEWVRAGVGSEYLAFGAAYYPWLHTSVNQQTDLSFLNIHPDSRAQLVACISDELVGFNPRPDTLAAQLAEVDKVITATAAEAGALSARLASISPFYKTVLREMTQRLNLLPPSAAMAGVYTLVDSTRGVWKAPANISLNGVISPAVPISQAQQEDLNAPLQGKSINAIRNFTSQGTLVWGARTLDGNSFDWRYINVRRTVIMIEESVRAALKALAFEPNVASTWVNVKAMISNFLTALWQRGAMAGATPKDAFAVNVGLGETMTAQDIQEGIVRVTVLVAITRPAEFIVISLQQQMKTP